MSEIKIDLEPFRVPNYVVVKNGIRSRQQGFVESPKYHISELSIEILEALCAKFREDILAKREVK